MIVVVALGFGGSSDGTILMLYIGGVCIGCFWVAVVVLDVLVQVMMIVIFYINVSITVLWQRVIWDTVTTLPLQFLHY